MFLLIFSSNSKSLKGQSPDWHKSLLRSDQILGTLQRVFQMSIMSSSFFAIKETAKYPSWQYVLGRMLTLGPGDLENQYFRIVVLPVDFAEQANINNYNSIINSPELYINSIDIKLTK